MLRNKSNPDIRNEVRTLAETAFHRQLISGYGDGEYPDKYQIVYKGKERHFTLEEAHTFLNTLLILNALS